MPRRIYDHSVEDVFKKPTSLISSPCSDLKDGELLTDLTGKSWRLGKSVGIGGFGEIFLAAEGPAREVKTDTSYVAKVERHSNGPLFVEINCYLRIAKPDMIDAWKKKNKLQDLGMPHYIASGSHTSGPNRYRFLIIPRFEKDLEQILKSKRKFNVKTVLTISSQILDVLEYMHANGYIHSDIKASNILLGGGESTPAKKPHASATPKCQRMSRSPVSYPIRTCRVKRMPRCTRQLRQIPVVNYVDDIPFISDILESRGREAVFKKPQAPASQVYLVDFGLAAKYVSSEGKHKDFSRDERKAHAGTVLFCSRDAHKGVISRRSDLESLAYNMIYWLTGTLPWYEDIPTPELVERKKQHCLRNISEFLQVCFPDGCPKFMNDFFNYLNTLQYDSKPDYKHCRSVFAKGLSDYGYASGPGLDFENREGWGSKQKKVKCSNGNSENRRGTRATLIVGPHRLPLHSNNVSFIKPLLRKKVKASKMHSMMNWSKILVQDPEVILKQANRTRERKTTEGSDACSMHMLDLEHLNPTYAMLEVYNKWMERGGFSPNDRGDSMNGCIDGYTPAMMAVYNRMRERRQMELQQHAANHGSTESGGGGGGTWHSKPRAVKRKNTTTPPADCKKKKVCKSRSSNNVSRGKSGQCASRDPVSRLRTESHRQTRKVKVVPIRRTYSLRG